MFASLRSLTEFTNEKDLDYTDKTVFKYGKEYGVGKKKKRFLGAKNLKYTCK
jgi:hypothetical protein